MNVQSKKKRSLQKYFGRSGFLLLGLLALLLAIAVFLALPRLERNLQHRAEAKLQTMDVNLTASSLRIEGRDAFLTLHQGSGADEQELVETLQQVRGVRRVHIERIGDVTRPGSTAEITGTEIASTLDVREVAEPQGLVADKQRLVDAEIAAPQSRPRGGSPEVAAVSSAQLPEENSVAGETQPNSATNLSQGGSLPLVQKSENQIVATANEETQVIAGDAAGDTPGISKEIVTADGPSGASQIAIGQSGSGEIPIESLGGALDAAQTEVPDGDQSANASEVAIEDKIGAQDEIAAVAESASSVMVEEPSADGSLSERVSGRRSVEQGVSSVTAAKNETTVVSNNAQPTQSEPALASSAMVANPAITAETAEIGVPHLELDFHSTVLRVSGLVTDQLAVTDIVRQFESVTSRRVEFDLVSGGALGEMPWLPGAVKVVGGLLAEDRGSMKMNERDGVELWVKAESLAENQAVTSRLRQLFTSAYPQLVAASNPSQTAGESPPAEHVNAPASGVVNGRVVGPAVASQDPAALLNQLLGSRPLFTDGSYFLTPESRQALDRVVAFFKENNGISVGLTARPDLSVLFPFGMVVGLNRALTARNYLLMRGIHPANVQVGGPPSGVALHGDRQIEFYQYGVGY